MRGRPDTCDAGATTGYTDVGDVCATTAYPDVRQPEAEVQEEGPSPEEPTAPEPAPEPSAKKEEPSWLKTPPGEPPWLTTLYAIFGPVVIYLVLRGLWMFIKS